MAHEAKAQKQEPEIVGKISPGLVTRFQNAQVQATVAAEIMEKAVEYAIRAAGLEMRDAEKALRDTWEMAARENPELQGLTDGEYSIDPKTGDIKRR